MNEEWFTDSDQMREKLGLAEPGPRPRAGSKRKQVRYCAVHLDEGPLYCQQCILLLIRQLITCAQSRADTVQCAADLPDLL